MYGKVNLFGEFKNKAYVAIVEKQIYTLQKVIENGKRAVV